MLIPLMCVDCLVVFVFLIWYALDVKHSFSFSCPLLSLSVPHSTPRYINTLIIIIISFLSLSPSPSLSLSPQHSHNAWLLKSPRMLQNSLVHPLSSLTVQAHLERVKGDEPVDPFKKKPRKYYKHQTQIS